MNQFGYGTHKQNLSDAVLEFARREFDQCESISFVVEQATEAFGAGLSQAISEKLREDALDAKEERDT